MGKHKEQDPDYRPGRTNNTSRSTYDKSSRSVKAQLEGKYVTFYVIFKSFLREAIQYQISCFFYKVYKRPLTLPPRFIKLRTFLQLFFH